VNDVKNIIIIIIIIFIKSLLRFIINCLNSFACNPKITTKLTLSSEIDNKRTNKSGQNRHMSHWLATADVVQIQYW